MKYKMIYHVLQLSITTTSALTAVENKFLVLLIQLKKTDYDAQVSEIENKLSDHTHDKYITTPEFNKLAADVFNARFAQANLVTKTDFDNKLSSLNRKIFQIKRRTQPLKIN